MALSPEEYNKLVLLSIKLGLTESMVAEVVAEVHKANEIIRELILIKRDEKKE